MTSHSSQDFFPRGEALTVTFEPPVRGVTEIGATLTIGDADTNHAVRFHLKDAPAALAVCQQIIDAVNASVTPPATPADVCAAPCSDKDIEEVLAMDLPGLAEHMNRNHF